LLASKNITKPVKKEELKVALQKYLKTTEEAQTTQVRFMLALPQMSNF
jgi:hypothetical protein